jgi:hypothetical protein
LADLDLTPKYLNTHHEHILHWNRSCIASSTLLSSFSSSDQVKKCHSMQIHKEETIYRL